LAYIHAQYGRELFTLNESEIPVPCETIASAASAGRVNLIENPESNSNEKSVAHYPNPFMTDFVLNVVGQEGASFDARISDLNGKAIAEYSHLLYNHDYTLGSSWLPGVYVLHVKKDNTLITTKIIKTR
jgi:hypothetical protein